jgi:RES domain-containing protein
VKFATPAAFVSGMGSLERGGRWNPPGLFPAVYGSLTAAVALDESRAAPAGYGIEPEAMRNLPLYMSAFHARVERLLDLTAGRVRMTIRVSRAAMRQEDWKAIQNRGEESLTQALGRACWEAGIEGILVPSAPSPKGVNGVFFPDRLLPSSALIPRPDADLAQGSRPRDRKNIR